MITPITVWVPPPGAGTVPCIWPPYVPRIVAAVQRYPAESCATARPLFPNQPPTLRITTEAATPAPIAIRELTDMSRPPFFDEGDCLPELGCGGCQSVTNGIERSI